MHIWYLWLVPYSNENKNLTTKKNNTISTIFIGFIRYGSRNNIIEVSLPAFLENDGGRF